jgi:lipopolysaccharide export system permease protein
VKIYRRDKAGRLIERIEAPSATYARGKGWTLIKPVIVRFNGEQVNVTPAASMSWPSPLHRQDVQALFADSPVPTAATARRALLNGGGDRPATFYETRLLAAFAGPFAALVMLLLSAPVALANFRSGQGAMLLAGGLATGLTVPGRQRPAVGARRRRLAVTHPGRLGRSGHLRGPRDLRACCFGGLNAVRHP